MNDRAGRWFTLGSITLVVALLAAVAGWGLGRNDADSDAAEASTLNAVPAGHAPGMDHGGGTTDHHSSQGGATGGTGGTVHGDGPAVPLDSATQKAVSAEMASTRAATMRFPDVAAAKAGGLIKVGNFAPGSGAHYMQKANADPSSPGRQSIVKFDAANPLMWLFAGNDDTSPVVGVMYFNLATTPPEGFAGPNDRWHQHAGLCIGNGPDGVTLPLPVDQDVTKEQCEAVQGRFMEKTGWMAHVWSAPGWESPEGVFSHDHPLLVCTDGKTSADAQLHVGCRGMA